MDEISLYDDCVMLACNKEVRDNCLPFSCGVDDLDDFSSMMPICMRKNCWGRLIVGWRRKPRTVLWRCSHCRMTVSRPSWCPPMTKTASNATSSIPREDAATRPCWLADWGLIVIFKTHRAMSVDSWCLLSRTGSDMRTTRPDAALSWWMPTMRTRCFAIMKKWLCPPVQDRGNRKAILWYSAGRASENPLAVFWFEKEIEHLGGYGFRCPYWKRFQRHAYSSKSSMYSTFRLFSILGITLPL